jgi:hypothetical protein
MKIWYRAVCDEHKEMCHILVNNPSCGASYLKEHDAEIQTWLEKHGMCNLRIVHRDDTLDEVLGVYEDFPESIGFPVKE